MRLKSIVNNWWPWIVWIIASSFFFSEYIVRVSPGVMALELMQDLKANALIVGLLSACFYYPYVLLQVPVGLLVDKYGSQRLLYTMATVSAFGCVIFAMSYSIISACLARVLIGFSAAFGFVGVITLTATWHPANKLGLIVGLTQSSGMLGAFCAVPLASIMVLLGWRQAVLLMAVLLVLIAIAIKIWGKANPDFVKKTSKQERLSMRQSLSIVLKNPNSWYNAIFVGFFFAPTAVLGEMWGPTFLRQCYSMSAEKGAMFSGFIFIGWIIGAPLLGWLSDKFINRKHLMIVSSVFLTLTISLLVFVSNWGLFTLGMLILLAGVFSGGVVISYTLSTELNIPTVSGTSLAFANMASVIVASILLPLVGWILDNSDKISYIDNIPIYSPEAFMHAFSLLVIGLVIGILFAFRIKGNYS
ncbi:MAG: MFS transporter [Legionellales bacterium]|nr:MFS transporter [Legionellales bacterium]